MRSLTVNTFAFVLILLSTRAQGVTFRINYNSFTNQSFRKVKAFEGQTVTFNTSITFLRINDSLRNEEMFFRCWMDYVPVGILVNWTDLYLPAFTSDIQLQVTLYAKRLGGSNLMCSVKYISNSSKQYPQKLAQLVVSRQPTIHELIFRIGLTVFVKFLLFVMGCGLDIRIIWGYLKEPVSPLIGFCSQFICMPLISAAVGKFSGIYNAFGLGLLVVGCSPGGGASNIWTVLFDGDLNLSMTMTFISTCAAFGMMPLWLFILGRLFIDPQNVKIPHGTIALNLFLIVLPTMLGIAFQWRWKRIAQLLLKKLKVMVILLLILIITYGTYVNSYIFKLLVDYVYLFPVGAMLPWLGFSAGYLLALITRRNKSQIIAIALETGFQNISIPLLILKYSMPQPDGDLGSVMPLVVAIFSPFPLYVGLSMTMLKQCFNPSKKELNQPNNTLENILLEDNR